MNERASRTADPVRVLAANVGLSEGPVFLQGGGLATVSLDRGHVQRHDENGVSILAIPGTGANGLAEGPDGSLFVAMSGRGGSRPQDGTPSGLLAVRPDGRLQWITQLPVAPNDLCFGPDGLIYLTDPTRGRRDDGRLWRIDVETGEAQLLVSVGWYPNGIGFGLDDHALLVADTSNGRMMRFPVTSDGLGPAEVAIQLDGVVPDGFAFDTEGNVIIAVQNPAVANPGTTPSASGPSGGDTVHTYSAAGELLDIYDPGTGELFTNLALSPDGRLVVTCGGNTALSATGRETGGCVLIVDDWPAHGVPLHPFRQEPGTR